MNIKSGFTLIEILIVVTILSILAAVVSLNLRPDNKIDNTMNTVRHADSRTIHNAIQQYVIDNEGYGELNITSVPQEICNTE
jgi:prepilin-type N-terminal cleavage/methylation domain-containing protein